MIVAVDSNVVVRLVTNDDPEQAEIARRQLEGQQVFFAKSVLLETEWVLRYTYHLDRSTIVEVLRALLGLEGAVVETPSEVLLAVDWYRHGLDFADALHLASSRSCDQLVTFDRQFAGVTAHLDGAPSVALLA